MYIAPGQGQTTPWEHFFLCQKFLITLPICCQFKTNLFEVWFFYRFYVCVFFQMYIAQGRGWQPIEDKSFMTTERPFLFAHMLQVSKWSLQNLILYTFFNYCIHVYSPEARADKPLGSKFWCQQKALNFHVFPHVYIAPGQGQTTLCGQNSDVNRKALSLCSFVAGLKKYLWSLILYIFLPIFIHVYSPGAGADNALGSEFWF